MKSEFYFETERMAEMKAVTYVGQFIEGQMYSSGKRIAIPEGEQVAVTFLGDISSNAEELQAEARRVAAMNFLQAVQELREKGFTEEDNAAIDALQSGMYKPHFEERL